MSWENVKARIALILLCASIISGCGEKVASVGGRWSVMTATGDKWTYEFETPAEVTVIHNGRRIIYPVISVTGDAAGNSADTTGQSGFVVENEALDGTGRFGGAVSSIGTHRISDTQLEITAFDLHGHAIFRRE